MELILISNFQLNILIFKSLGIKKKERAHHNPSVDLHTFREIRNNTENNQFISINLLRMAYFIRPTTDLLPVFSIRLMR